MDKVTVYTDGACAGNGTRQSRGGWAAIVTRDGSDESEELFDGCYGTSNQRMEITAAIGGLRALVNPSEVVVCSDSAYVINCMKRRWFDRWRVNGWIGSNRRPVANRDLWEELLDLTENHGHRVSFLKVRGHADRLDRVSTPAERYNQRCDALAVAACPPAR